MAVPVLKCIKRENSPLCMWLEGLKTSGIYRGMTVQYADKFMSHRKV